MISQIGSAALRNAYVNDNAQTKEAVKKESANIVKQGDTSKVEEIKMALESGEYKINLQALSKKIAEELL